MMQKVSEWESELMPLHVEAMAVMSDAFRQFEGAIAPPQKVSVGSTFVFRYANKGILEAIVQKLARSISGLNAVYVLVNKGFVQEAGILFRTLDEIHEDIQFLAVAVTNNAKTERHERYLEAFYAEPVFGRAEGSLDMRKPNLVPRKKIRAHTVNVLSKGVNVSQALAAAEALSTAYSGFVHASSESIMDMFGGEPPRFFVEGMPGTPRIAECARTLRTYIVRGLMTSVIAAKAFGDRALVEALHQFLEKYELANDMGTEA